MHVRSMYRMQLVTTLAVVLLVVTALLYTPSTQKRNKDLSSTQGVPATTSIISGLPDQLSPPDSTTEQQLIQYHAEPVTTDARHHTNRLDPQQHVTYMQRAVKEPHSPADRFPASPQHASADPLRSMYRPHRQLEQDSITVTSENRKQRQLTHARKLQTGNNFPTAPFQERCFRLTCKPPGSSGGINVTVNTSINPDTYTTYLWDVCWPLLAEHGYKNTSLYVPLNIRAATRCHESNPLCVLPPDRNPYNGARIMDCSTWYYNTSSIMVQCPIMPRCCDDAQCYDDSQEISNHEATVNACWAQHGQICSIDWNMKHHGASCDTTGASIPNSYDANNWTACVEPYSDCQGVWNYGPCSATCAGGLMQGTFTITKKPSWNGTACAYSTGAQQWFPCNTHPCPINCVGYYTNWTACSHSCGGGTQNRTYMVTTAAAHGGSNCPAANGTVETQSCNLQPCPVDCVGSWSNWSSCGCGNSTRNSTFVVTQEAAHNGSSCEAVSGTVRSQACYTHECPVHCVGSWVNTTACDKACGSGHYNRTFQVTTQAAHSGATCLWADGAVETVVCNLPPCPVDCVGIWTHVSNCTRPCGNGTLSSVFVISNPAQHDGVPCEAMNGTVRTENCNLQECPVNCEGQWSNWTDCNKTCGSGIQNRTYMVGTAAAYGGSDCPVAAGTVEVQSCNTQPCPVNCSGSWSGWTSCNQTCGSGTQSRTFLITTAAAHGGNACLTANGTAEVQSCNTQPCPVNCSGTWSDWTSCSQTCGSGLQTRSFLVATEAAHGGNACLTVNSTTEVQPCNTQPCPVNCSGAWSSWSPCNQTCGSGAQSRIFLVTTAAAHGGSDCTVVNGAVEVRSCNTQPCPVNCSGTWSEWSLCNQTCGSGLQSRIFLIQTEAAYDGSACLAANGTVEVQSCNTQPCPVNCSGTWSDLSPCNQSCGSGLQTRTFLVATEAVHGGNACLTANGTVEVQSCNSQPCPVNCSGAWSHWTACNQACGSGLQSRTFLVTTAAAHGGNACNTANSTVEDQPCNTQPCPVNCSGAWSSWSSCNQTCGSGLESRTFLITTEAAHGGTACLTADGTVEVQSCNTQPCPVNCSGAWSDWTACNQTCGSGAQSRTFLVTTAAAHGGNACSTANGTMEVQVCNTQPCPVDCSGTWSEWSSCNQTCSSGLQTRTFFTVTEGAHGGTMCSTANGTVEVQSCNTQPCPVNCRGAWLDWSPCNQTCGSGIQTRTFLIATVAADNGTACATANGTVEVQSCNTQPCAVNCSGAWSEWTLCNQTCGSGTQTRSFLIATAATHGGNACLTANGTVEVQSCNTQPCPVNCSGAWSEWTPCNQTCGSGIQTTTFSILTHAANGGVTCSVIHGTLETQTCNPAPCPIDCEGGWSDWSICSATCGGGLQNRSFHITVPSAYGGANCTAEHGAIDIKTCNDQPCPVNCVGSWVTTKSCSPPCSSNTTHFLTFVITTEAANGGVSCEAANGTTKIEVCNSTCPSALLLPSESPSQQLMASPSPAPQPSPVSPEPQSSPDSAEPQPPPQHPEITSSPSPALPQQGYPSAPETPDPPPAPPDAPPAGQPASLVPNTYSGGGSEASRSAAAVGGAVAGALAVAGAAAAYMYFTKQRAAAADAARVVPKLRTSLKDLLVICEAAAGAQPAAAEAQAGPCDTTAEELSVLQPSHNSILINNPLYQLTMQQLARPRVSVSEVILSASGGCAAAASTAAAAADGNAAASCQRLSNESHDSSSSSRCSRQGRSDDTVVRSRFSRDDSFFLSIDAYDAETAAKEDAVHLIQPTNSTVTAAAAAAAAASTGDPGQRQASALQLVPACSVEDDHQAAASSTAAAAAAATATECPGSTILSDIAPLPAVALISNTGASVTTNIREAPHVQSTAAAAAPSLRARAWLSQKIAGAMRAIQHTQSRNVEQLNIPAAGSSRGGLSLEGRVYAAQEQQQFAEQQQQQASSPADHNVTRHMYGNHLQQEGQINGQQSEYEINHHAFDLRRLHSGLAVRNTVVPVGLDCGLEISNPLFDDVSDDLGEDDLAGIAGFLSNSGT